MELITNFDWDRYGFVCYFCGTETRKPVILARVTGTRDTQGRCMVVPVHFDCLGVFSVRKERLKYKDNEQGQRAKREIEQSYKDNKWHNV